ncbi:PaaI family thioesterase [soil metagenome]
MLEFPTRIPFADLLGIRLMRYENGEADVWFDPAAEVLNSWGVIHGGAQLTLIDICMSHAARSAAASTSDDVRGAATIELKTSFMRPGVGPLTAKGRVLHRTATLAFCEGSIFDSKNELISHATGTFKFMRALPGGDRKVHALNAPQARSKEQS